MLHLLNSSVAAERDDSTSVVEIRVEASGHLLLTEDVRHRLGIQPGDALLLDVTNDGILIWTREMAARALVDLVSRSVPPSTSLVDELSRMCRADATAVREQARATPMRSQRGGR